MKSLRKSRGGFTLLEIMIGAAIISLLAMLVIPAFKKAQRKTKRTKLIQELRVTGDSFEIYAADHDSDMPDSVRYGAYPVGMETYLPKNSSWTGEPPGGGYWSWLWFDGSKVNGSRGFVAVLNSELTADEFQLLDEEIDNGNLTSGGVIYSEPWLLYGVN